MFFVKKYEKKVATYTRVYTVSEVRGSTSWLVHCLSSTAVHDSVGKISVVYNCISHIYTKFFARHTGN